MWLLGKDSISTVDRIYYKEQVVLMLLSACWQSLLKASSGKFYGSDEEW